MEKIIKNTAEIRGYNKKAILSLLKTSNLLTKKEISIALKQSFATTSNLCNQLIDDGYIQNKPSQSSSGGRIPELYTIDRTKKFICTINLTQKESFIISIMNLSNEIINLRSSIISSDDNLQSLLIKIFKLYQNMLVQSSLSDRKIIGVGIAVSGIYHNGKVFSENFPFLENQEIKIEFENQFSKPVFIENDSNLLALASLEDKNNKAKANVIYIFCYDGPGIGIISDGKLIKGNGFGGEITQIPVFDEESGITILENKLSISSIIKEYNQKSNKSLTCNANGWKQFLEILQTDDDISKETLNEIVKTTSYLVSILVNIFDPTTIYFGGILEDIFDAISKNLENNSLKFRNRDDTVYKKSKNHRKLISVGCSELVFNNFKL